MVKKKIKKESTVLNALNGLKGKKAGAEVLACWAGFGPVQFAFLFYFPIFSSLSLTDRAEKEKRK